MDLEEIPYISEELNVEFSTINNSSQEPLEAETDEACVPSICSRACLQITLTQRATNSTFHLGRSSPDMRRRQL